MVVYRTAPELRPYTLRQALLEFKRLYNEHWLIERHGYKTPLQVRKERLELQKAA
jgi:hypothetical protein